MPAATPGHLVPETPPVEPEEEFEGPESEEDVRVEPPAAPRIEVPRMTPEEGLRRRPPMPVRDPEPEAEVEGRPRFQYVDDVVEAYVQGPEIEPPYVADPIAAAAPPPVPAAERRELLIPGRVAGEPSGIFAQRPFTFPDLPPDWLGASSPTTEPEVSACCSNRVGRRSVGLVSGTAPSISRGLLSVQSRSSSCLGSLACGRTCEAIYATRYAITSPDCGPYWP